MQFESHLGHNRSPRQGRFCFNVLTKLAVASSDGLVCGLWPGRLGAYSGVWVAGPGHRLVVLRLLCRGYAVPRFRFCRVEPGGLHLFMCRGSGGLHDRWAFDTRPSVRGFTAVKGPCVPPFVQPKGVWRLSTLTSDLMLRPAPAGSSGDCRPTCRSPGSLMKGCRNRRCSSSRRSNSFNDCWSCRVSERRRRAGMRTP